ncbi:hypothetical protein ACX12L_10820 [Alicycliphilus sp. T452]|jgi:hypothetical protein
MKGALISLLETVFDTLLDTWWRREHRQRRGRAQRPLGEDLAEVAYFNVVTVTVWGVVACAVFFTLHLGFGLPFGWSFAGAVVPVGIYLGWRFIRLLNQ